MRDLVELGMNEGGKPVSRSPATDDGFRRFELRYGISIPDTLRRVLRHSNGGHPLLNTFSSGTEILGISRFYYLSEDEHLESLGGELTTWKPFLGDSALPFADDGCGNVYFIDLRDGLVKLCLHEEEMLVQSLNLSLEELIERLALDEEAI